MGIFNTVRKGLAVWAMAFAIISLVPILNIDAPILGAERAMAGTISWADWITSPSGGEKLKGGSTFVVRWDNVAHPVTSTITLNLLIGTTSQLIKSGLANNGSYTWTVPSTAAVDSKNCRIMITTNNGTTYIDTSEVFTIDSVGPTIPTFLINNANTIGGILYANSTTESLTIGAVDNATSVVGMRFKYYYYDNTPPAKWVPSTEIWTPWEPYSASKLLTLSYTMNGNYNLYVQCSDEVGNTSLSAQGTNKSVNFYIDTVMPMGAIIIGNGNPAFTNSTSQTLYLTYSDPATNNKYASGVLQQKIKNDGDLNWTVLPSLVTTKSSWPIPSVDGLKTVYYQVIDKAGNSSTFMDMIVLDTTPPSVGFTMAPFYNGNNFNVPSSSITGTASDGTGSGVNTVYLKIRNKNTNPAQYWNGSAWSTTATVLTATGTTNWSYIGSGNGLPAGNLVDNASYEVQAYAKDALGNVSAAPTAFWTFTFDVKPPVANITSPASGSVQTGTITFTGTASDDSNAPYTYSMSYAPVSNPTNKTIFKTAAITQSPTPLGTLDPASMAEGAYRIELSVSSPAGNTSTAAVDVVIDKTPPVTTCNLTGTAGDNGYYTSNVSVSLAAADAASGIYRTYYQLNGGSWNVGTSLSIPNEGTNTLKYYSVDNAGFVEATKEVTIKIDKTAPVAPSINFPGNNYITKEASITFSGTCPADTDRIYLNGELITSYVKGQTNWQTTITLSAGIHDYTVTVKDAAGLPSEAKVSVNLDKTEPAAPTINPVASPFKELVQSISGTTDASAKQVLIKTLFNNMLITTDTVTVLNSTWSYTAQLSQGEGNYTIRAQAIDAAGNYSAFSQATIIADRTAPSQPYVQGIPSEIKADHVIISGNYYDDTANIVITKFYLGTQKGSYDKASGVTLTGGAWSFNLPLDSGDGLYRIEVKALDLAGNASAIASVQTTRDILNPEGDLHINSGDAYTNNPNVVLNIGVTADPGTPVVEMRFGNSLAELNGASFVAVAPTFDWMLPMTGGDGEKIVYMQLKDHVGNVSSPIPASITLDQTPPVISDIKLNDNSLIADNLNPAVDYRVTKPTPKIEISASDNYSNFVSDPSRVVVDFVQGGTIIRTLAGALQFTVAGSDPLKAGDYTLRVTVTDRAGNTSVQEIGGIKVSGGDPQITSIVIVSPNPFNPLAGGVAKIWFTVSADPTATVAVYLHDITGRQIWKRTYTASQLLVDKKVEWNGYNDYNEIAGNGVYLVRVVDETNKKLIGKTKLIIIKSK